MTEFRSGVVVGRDPICDVVVDDPYISKQHARLSFERGTLIIEDMASLNGTYVNEVQVWRSLLDAGTDRVRMGRTEWTAAELIDIIRHRFDRV